MILIYTNFFQRILGPANVETGNGKYSTSLGKIMPKAVILCSVPPKIIPDNYIYYIRTMQPHSRGHGRRGNNLNSEAAQEKK